MPTLSEMRDTGGISAVMGELSRRQAAGEMPTTSHEVLTLPEYERWLKKLQGKKWAALNANRQIGKKLRQKTRRQIRRHQSPDGRPWPKTYAPPVRVGQTALVSKDKNKNPVVLKNIRMVKKERRLREQYGPPLRPLQALYRRHRIGSRAGTGAGRQAVRKIFDFLGSVRAISARKDGVRFGYTPGTYWVEKVANGGRYRGGQVPRREIVGLTKQDINACLDILAAAYIRTFK